MLFINFWYNSRIFQCIDALRYRKVSFGGSICLHNEEAASLVEVRVVSNLEVLKVLHLFISALMELNNVLHEGLVFIGQCLTIIFKVQNTACLRLYLANVDIDDASNFVLGLRTLDSLFLRGHIHFLVFAGNTDLVGGAEAVVISVVIPEIFQVFVFRFGKGDGVFLNGGGVRCS